MNERTLTLDTIKYMTIDEIIDAYKNGYVLDQLSPATCPSSILQGLTKNITVTLTSVGTPGYVYKLYVDGALKQTYPTTGKTPDTSHIFSYTFSEAPGSHIVKAELTDSCSTPKIVSDQCAVNITVCTTPIVSITCPSSPVTQGSIRSITAQITTPGTSPYVYKLYVDGILEQTYPTTGTTTDTSHIFTHTFSEAPGSHTYRVDVIDSCPTGALIGTKSCIVAIQSVTGCTTPIVSVTCPSSITRGVTGNITASITTAGTPGYIYKLYADGVLKQTYPTTGTTTAAIHTFSHIFNETVGPHTYRVNVTDSCIDPGPITVYDSCVTNVQQPAEAGFGMAGMVLMAGVAIGAIYLATTAKSKKP